MKFQRSAVSGQRSAVSGQRSGSRLPALAALLVLLCALLVVFSLLFASPPPLFRDIGSPGDATVLLNFYQPERDGATTFRWSGPGARLRLHDLTPGPDSLRLRLNASPRTGMNPRDGAIELWLRQDKQTLAAFAMQPGWRIYTILLPQDGAASGDAQPEMLQLVTPVSRQSATDDRYLGVPVDWLELSPLSAATPLQAMLSEQALLLTWLLALLLVTPIASRRWARAEKPLSACWLPWLLRGTGVMAAAALLLIWAWRAPYSLVQMLPLTPWHLALATLLLLALSVGWTQLPAPRFRVSGSGFRVSGSGFWVLGAGLLLHLLLLAPLPLEWRGSAALLLLLLPGALLAWRLFRNAGDPLRLAFLGLCGGLAVMPLPLLALQALPGSLPGWLVLLAFDGLSIVLMLTAPRRPLPPAHRPLPPAHRPLIAALFLALCALFLRLAMTGNSEFQGDESRAIMMAAGVVHGQDNILLLRPKGPVEVLIPAGLMALTGQMNEWLARVPFALAGIGALLGCYVLAHTIFAHHGDESPDHGGMGTGLLAVLILTLDGFMIAFARIVQYQSVIMMMMLGALWCGWQFYAQAGSREEGTQHEDWFGSDQRYLVSAAVLCAVAMLSHYDGALVLPALAWLVLAGGWRRQWRGMQWIRALAAPVLIGAGLLLSFYLPFVLNEHFHTATTGYLSYRLREGNTTTLTFNNLVGYYNLATFYSTTFQIHALAVALLAGIVAWLLRYACPRNLGRGFVLLLLAGCAVLLWQPAAFNLPGGFNWAIVAFGGPLVALALFPSTPASLRVLVLWFAAPFIVMSFVIAEPRTHFYAMNIPAALLISLASSQLWQWLTARRLDWARIALAGAGGVLVLLAIPYLYIAFIRPHPEYLRDFPRSRPAIYRAGYGDDLPTDAGYFAFPQRDGWKVAALLYRLGVLQGSYASNKKALITGWYMRGIYRCDATPDYFLLARSESYLLPEGYDLFGYITIQGRRMMDIYSRTPLAATSIPQEFQLEDYISRFDALPVEQFPTQRFLFDVAPQYPLQATWQQGIHLRGYDLFDDPLIAGEMTLVLYWQADQPLPADYEVVVDVLDNTYAPIAQATPYCTPIPPGAWHTSTINETTFRLPLSDFRVGLRHRETGAWLPLTDGSAQVELIAPR